ncbi:MAG TPA: gamma-glutamyltransferase family protein [Solirubrobacteraceae bacterium]|nr:gamma-glutamyltransferase family protein [Solirubrobacteraceae bacterium]
MRRSASAIALAALAVVLAVLPSAAAASVRRQAVATGTGGAVASMDVGASNAGIQVLKRGGNAVDAAVATASALGVTIPFVAGPGGGGFMVIYDARAHRVITIDGRETCPAACTSKLFVNPATGKPLDYDSASEQPLSTGVPSMVATWAAAIRRYGRKSFASDLQPAISVAQHGFRVNADFRQLTEAGLGTLRAYPASRALLLTKAGKPLPVGTRLRNPDLAKTYRLLAQHGPSYLYDGPLGEAIVQALDHPQLQAGNHLVTRPGIMTMTDLRAYRAKVRRPTHVRYRGLDIYGMAPPSSGGSTIGEALNILSGWNLGAEPRTTAMFHYLEASRLAYADRDAYIGDPAFAKVPLSGLLSPSFAATRRCLVHAKALISPVAAGDPSAPHRGCARGHSAANPFAGAETGAVARSASPEQHHTNNIVTTDRWGDIVAYTNTINFFGGSGQTVPGYGFLLNDELTDFDFAPPTKGAADPNLPAAGKRPRSSMGPVIALRDGRPQFTIGAAGGSTIPETILQTLIGHVDFGMPLPVALAAPRVSQTDSPASEAEPAFYHSALRRRLSRQFGEKFALATGSVLPLDHYPGDATAMQFLAGHRTQAIAEPVRLGGGSALVVDRSR